MASLNKVIFIGNITHELELKQTQSGVPVLRFSIAINRNGAKDGERKADFANIVAWRQTAEFISRYFKKGKPIFICGKMENRSYTEKNGTQRNVVEFVADEVDFVESKQASDTRSNEVQAENQIGTAHRSNTVTPAPFVPDDDDDLPF